ncbi:MULTISPECIES: RcnB family protein [unclassified Acinetobacter]|nr:RcnB family protein [Acinetobacter sp. ANC 5600]
MKYKKLSKPGKNQQWIKVNGDYILMNAVSHAMIKIIAG